MFINKNLVFNGIKLPSLILQFSEKVKWRDVSLPCTNCSIFVKPFTTSVCNLGKRSAGDPWSDDSFSDELLKNLKQPKVILPGLYNFIGEFGKLYEEKKMELFWNKLRYKNENDVNNIDMLFTFDREEEFNKFEVTADSTHYGGYSSASLKMSPIKTGLFTGNICSELPKDGEAKFAGYASMITKKNLRSFKRVKYYDFTDYTHMVLKVRGDGRTYFIHLTMAPQFQEQQHWVYSYPLFTRGGPHWQVSKIAFSDFYFVSRGLFGTLQPRRVFLKKVMMVGLTVRQVEGSFKLEIDYIGLEKKNMHRAISPYEQYA